MACGPCPAGVSTVVEEVWWAPSFACMLYVTLTATLRCHCSHFTDQETEAWKDSITVHGYNKASK